MKKISLFIILTLVTATPAFAVTHIVKQDGTGDYTTIQACADAAQPGDTCLVFSGTYSGFTAPTSGSSGNRITFLADSSGAQPSITSNVTLNNRSYITIDGFHLDGAEINCSSGSRCSFVAIQNNLIEEDGTAGKTGITSLYGDDILISDNKFEGVTDDPTRGWGDQWVIRNNLVIAETDVGDDHMDMWQVWCGGGGFADADYLLTENNQYINISGGNVHFMLQNQSTCNRFFNIIIRHNRIKQIGSGALSFSNAAGGTAGFENIAVYNNLFAELYGGSFASWQDYVGVFNITTDGYFYNNLLYNAVDRVDAEAIYPSSIPADCTLAYDTGGSISTDGALQSSSGSIINQDPLLTNYANNDFTLQTGSPAINAGCPLTNVNTADSGSGTTLILDETAFFQDGWAGVDADWIAVGSPTNTVQISSIDYNSDIITLATPISRSDGDPVYLYRDSDGTRVLYGSAPDIGAVESGTNTILASPTGLRFMANP